MTQSGNRTRDLILELWTRIRIDWGFATDRLAEAFRKRRELGARERREVAETLYGMIRQARRVDFALEGFRLSGDRRELARLTAYRLLEGQLDPGEAARALPGDWEAVARVDERIERERDPARRLGLRRSLPDWLARRFLAEYGDEADALAAALNERAPLALRANSLRTTREALAGRLAGEGLETHATVHAQAGLIADTRVNVYGLAAFKEGLFEAQDEASQLVAELVAPPPRGLVVDACAGAGGKTLALGALLGSRGRIVALDIDERKLEELRRRARRAGLTNARAVTVTTDGWPDEVAALAGRADRVLVDAPCSGIGALRRNPEARWRLTEEDLRRLPDQQRAIARRAWSLVAPGGRLVYATCTVLRAENEDVAAALGGAGWEPVRPAEIWGGERARALVDASGFHLKLLPHRHGTDGFFAAVWRKRASGA
jgi:16S rRNA (cytosine967-C5)-methyltransferase